MKKVNIKLDISTKKQIYIIVLLLSIFIVAFGYWYYSAEKKQIIHQKEQTLKSIATLKAKQVVDWYNDELCDAGVMADNPFLQEILASYYMRPSDSNFARLVDILKQCKIEHELADVILTTPDGKVIASATNSFERLASQEIASINSSAKSGKSVSTDFFRISENGQDKIFISFTSTIELRGTSHYSLVFRADPNDFLYPLIESWPLPSQTAESYLFRVEGDSIVFLSNLRHNKFTALSFKLPISIEKYSLRGILDGNENHFTRKDYRKVEVKSYATQLVGTPWYLVSEVDKSELLNELPRTALKVILQILFIVLFAVFTIAYLYRTRQKNIFENLYKAEKELWQQNEKFRVTIDSLGDGVIVTDMKSIIQFMNLRAEQLTGWRFREAKGRNLSEVYTVKNEQTGLKENNILEKVIKKGIVKELANHTLLIAKNGDEIPVMDTGAPIYNSNGEITGIVIAFQDETERRQQKRLLVDSEARYRDFFEADLTGDYIATPDGEILDCNPAFIEILGYATAEELIGRNIAEMYKSPTEREEFLNLIQNQKVVRNYKSKLKRKDGTNIICIRNSVGKFDDNGKLVKYFSYIYDITDQIHAEEEIRKNDSFFRLIFANTPDVLFIQDCNLTYSFIINPPHPLTPEDVVGKSDWDLLPPEEAKVLTELKTKIIETGEPIRQEICLSPGGIQRWYDVIYQPIFESDGQKVCIASYSRDITERKFSEEALIKKDQLLSSVMETQQEFICRYLPDTTLTFVNKAYCKHFGRSENEVVGQNYLQFMPKSEWDLELSRLAQLNKQNPSITSISQAYKADGSLISIEWTDLAIFNAQNEVVEIQSVGRDITEQLKAEQEVIFQSQMQEMLRTIASTYINIPLELVDYEIQNSLEKLGRFVEADRAYIFDYDWVKNTCSNTYEWCQDGIEPQIQVLQNFPLGDISQWVNAHKTGKTLYIPDVFELEINDAVRQILEPQGIKSLLTIPIMRDDVCIGFLGFDSVSKHHTYSEADEKLLSIFAQLIVNVKNREILESSLVIEKEKANESNRLKTSFLQNLSLVIRTPMNGILGFTDLLKSSLQDPKVFSQYIEVIELSGNRLMRLITDLIDISKIETGQIYIENVEFNVNNVISELEFFFKNVADEKGLEVRVGKFLPEFDCEIVCDNGKLFQILSNLLYNAIKFSEKGVIEFGCEWKGSNIEFYVKDQGIGIPKEKQSAIFTRFVQGDTSISRGYEGAGLGLSICKAYVEKIGGNIWVESEPGDGSTFYFTIPHLMKTHNNNILTEALSTEKVSGTKSKLKVLIVDDDRISLLLLEKIITEISGEVLLATNGCEAIDICKKNVDIDIILMDLKMPKLDGCGATQEIRKFNKDVVIIAQTAYAYPEDQEKALKSGCNDFVTKPLSREVLIKLINNHIK